MTPEKLENLKLRGKVTGSKKNTIALSMAKSYNNAVDRMITEFQIEMLSKDAKQVKVINPYDTLFDYEEKVVTAITAVSKRATAGAKAETYIKFNPNEIKRGAIIKFKYRENSMSEKVCLCASQVEEQRDHDRLVFYECNQSLKLPWAKDPEPCFSTNDSYGSKTMLDNESLSFQDAKAKISVQCNYNTLQIKRDMRFAFSNSKYDFYKVIDINISMTEGIMTIIMKKDLYLDGLDDLDTNEAFDKFIGDEVGILYEIKGKDYIRVGQEGHYKLNMSGSVRWEIDDTSVADFKVGTSIYTNECTVIPKENSVGECFTLRCLDTSGNIVANLVINVTK